jgi:hypothetical protein
MLIPQTDKKRPPSEAALLLLLGMRRRLSRLNTLELMNETASRALPGMSRLSVAIIVLSFALLIGAFVLTVYTF